MIKGATPPYDVPLVNIRVSGLLVNYPDLVMLGTVLHPINTMEAAKLLNPFLTGPVKVMASVLDPTTGLMRPRYVFFGPREAAKSWMKVHTDKIWLAAHKAYYKTLVTEKNQNSILVDAVSQAITYTESV